MIAAVISFLRAGPGQFFVITGGRIARITRCLTVRQRPTCVRPRSPIQVALLLVAVLALLLFGRLAAEQDRFPGAVWDYLIGATT